MFVLKRDVKLQLTHTQMHQLYYFTSIRDAEYCSEHVCMLFVCMSSRMAHTSKLHKIFSVLLGAVARSSSDDSCALGFVNDDMFSNNGPYGVWNWQYLRDQCAEAGRQNSQYICRGTPRCCLTLLAMMTYRALSLVGGLPHTV